jgi:hypothetical protein
MTLENAINALVDRVKRLKADQSFAPWGKWLVIADRSCETGEVRVTLREEALIDVMRGS